MLNLTFKQSCGAASALDTFGGKTQWVGHRALKVGAGFRSDAQASRMHPCGALTDQWVPGPLSGAQHLHHQPPETVRGPRAGGYDLWVPRCEPELSLETHAPHPAPTGARCSLKYVTAASWSRVLWVPTV